MFRDEAREFNDSSDCPPAPLSRYRSAFGEGVKRVAAVVTEYRCNTHADAIVSRVFQTDTLDGKGPQRRLKVVSLYMDQLPKGELGRALAKKHGFAISRSVAGALTLGGDHLVVDAVLLVAEHGDYPSSPTGQTIYPKRRLFEQIVDVFRRTGQVVPVFIDKHLADNWNDASWIYETARALNIPLMAGSSLPVTWRDPPDDVQKESRLAEILVLSYRTLDSYGFHALEIAQALAEVRKGGESGVARVRCVEGAEVWRRLDRRRGRPRPAQTRPRGAAHQAPRGPVAAGPRQGADSLSGDLPRWPERADLDLKRAVGEWSGAWRDEADTAVHASLFYAQEARPQMHFTYLLRGIETMFLTGKPTWPVERTLLTSGVMDRLLISRKEGGRLIETPELGLSYQSSWRWSQPPPPPPDRPLDGP